MQQLQPDQEEPHICQMCVGDEVLREEVRFSGICHACSYCGEMHPAFQLGRIARRIHEVMATQFELTPEDPVDVEEYIAIALDLEWERKSRFRYSPRWKHGGKTGCNRRGTAARNVVAGRAPAAELRLFNIADGYRRIADCRDNSVSTKSLMPGLTVAALE